MVGKGDGQNEGKEDNLLEASSCIWNYIYTCVITLTRM